MEIYSGSKFCHYTSVENVRSILNSECFYLSRFDRMNDLAEAKLHKEDGMHAFVLSLCNSNALNIPMFYLYGGIDGKGCKIQMTDAKVRQIINGSTLSYVNKQGKRLKKTIDRNDYDIVYDWVYYISSNGFCEHKNDNPKQYKNIDDAVGSLKLNNKHFFIKNPIWKYEHEFRVVVVFKENIPYERVSLNFNIKEKEKSISVALGPETTEVEYDDLSSEFRDYGIANTIRTSAALISMNLIKRNEKLLKKGA